MSYLDMILNESIGVRSSGERNSALDRQSKARAKGSKSEFAIHYKKTSALATCKAKIERLEGILASGRTEGGKKLTKEEKAGIVAQLEAERATYRKLQASAKKSNKTRNFDYSSKSDKLAATGDSIRRRNVNGKSSAGLGSYEPYQEGYYAALEELGFFDEDYDYDYYDEDYDYDYYDEDYDYDYYDYYDDYDEDDDYEQSYLEGYYSALLDEGYDI